MDFVIGTWCFYFLVFITTGICNGEVIQLNNDNLNNVLNSNELVFINFYADWCRFSQILKPVFEETADKIKEEFPNPGKVVFAKVDSDRETAISSSYHISKYPTLKLVRSGQVMRKEYRGQRSVDALANYIRDQLKEVIEYHRDLQELDNIDENKRNLIGYFGSQDSESFKTFHRLSTAMREECSFHAVIGPASEMERTAGDKVVFRPPKTKRQDIQYTQAPLEEYDSLANWANENCMPLVREITFENAEELTEEGLPFLILFHHPDDKEIVEKFHKAVVQELLSQRTAVNFLTADGLKFSHPLHHLGKSASDLPILAIDSFRHMYLFPRETQKLDEPGALSQFVADLHSGKLHREFHHGPDPTTAYPTPPPPGQQNQDGSEQPQHLPHDVETPGGREPVKQPTSPPESVFKKLAPSRNRYTMRDEL